MRISLQRWREYLTWRLIITFGLAYVCMWLFSKLQKGIANDYLIVRFDLQLANALHNAATPPGTTLFRVISFLGYEVAWGVTLLIALYFVFKRENWKAGLWLLGTVMGEILNFALKNLYDRPRPVFVEPLVIATYASFPSGHAMKSLIVYGLLAYFLIISTTNLRLRIVIVFATTLLIVLVGISRLYLGVHYFSDVVGGFAVGGIWLTACIV
ncbi:MAG: phosphatase PAP2 family protein, partial [Anaerolineae bacterium]|nr:phosphatase PAP2 family protein [Anaerolineae bacterium]